MPSNTSEPGAAADSGKKPKPRPSQGIYVPKIQQKYRQENPDEKNGYLARMEVLEERRGSSKPYDDVEIGDFVIGPCFGLAIFNTRIGITPEARSRYEGNQLDNVLHPQIVIGKDDNAKRLLTIVFTTLGMGNERKTFRNKPSIDIDQAVKYFVPSTQRDFEGDDRQPNFKVELVGKLYTELKEKIPGWACTCMFLRLGAKDGLFKVLDVKVTSDTVRNLQWAVDQNEPERTTFIREKYYELLERHHFSHYELEGCISRTRHASLTVPPKPERRRDREREGKPGRNGDSQHRRSRGSGDSWRRGSTNNFGRSSSGRSSTYRQNPY